MILTVKDMLEIRDLDELNLLGGKEGIDNKINSINIMDNPDTINWLKKDEFLITTGFVFKDDEDLRLNLIKNMHSIGCSGLAIKTKRYFESIPEDMILEANKYNFPLIEIPFKYSLSYVTTVFYKKMYTIQKLLLKKSYDIHKKLTGIVLEGGELDKICEEVVNLISNPFIILDEKGRLLSYSEHPNNPKQLKKFLNLNVGQPILNQSFIDLLPDDLSMQKEAIKIENYFSPEKIVMRIKPIIATEKINGYIIVWETVKKMRRLDYVAIEQASIVISLERLKQKAIENTKHMIRKDFFDDLLEGRIGSINIIKNLCEIHGLDINKSYVCIVTKIKNFEVYKDELYNNNDLYRYCKEIIKISNSISAEVSRSAISIYRKNLVITFFQCYENEDDRASKDAVKNFAKKLYNYVSKSFNDLNIYIGIGNKYRNLMDLRKSFNEAIEALRMVNRFYESKHVVHYSDFIIYHLLDTGTSKEQLEIFYENTVKKLVEYDKDNNSNLITTLEAYFSNNGNVSEAAKEIFVHRNTFMYRLDKIKTILNSELKDAEELLEIQLGLKAMNILSKWK